MTAMAMRGGSRWRGVVAVAGLVGLAVAVVMIALLLRGKALSTAANVAQLVAVVLAVPSLAVGLMAWWDPRTPKPSTAEQVELAQEKLRTLVRDQWREEISIRELDDLTRLAVHWRITELDVMDHADRVDGSRFRRTWFGLGRPRFSGRTDKVDKIARRFRELARQRLVILGEPGMGKTTLALLLLCELIEQARPGDPVPVLLSMTGWDPRTERLHRWLARRLYENYPALRATAYGRDAATALVSRRRILPVLDGLDELPEHVQPQVLSALNRATGVDAVILTCRTAEYEAAVRKTGSHVLVGAAVIEPRPIKPADAAAYISSRLHPGQMEAWSELLVSLRTDLRGPFAQALRTPLSLWLLRKVYIDTHRDPAALCDTARFPTADAITDHLLDDLVHATLSEHDLDDLRDHHHPFEPRHLWAADDAKRWLSFLAHHMCEIDTSDLQWWQLYRAVHRRWSILVGAVTVGLAVGLTVGTTCGFTIAFTDAIDGTIGDALLFGLTGGLTGGLVGGLTGGTFLALRRGPTVEPAYADLRLRRRGRLLAGNVAFGLTVGLAIGVVAALLLGLFGGLAGGVMDSLMFGLAVGAAGGFTVGLSRWVSTPATNAQPQTPGLTLRRDLELVYVRSLAFGLTLGPAFGFAGALAKGFVGLWSAVQTGVAFGIAGGLVYTLIINFAGASSTYLVVVSALWMRGRVPLRLMRFLDDIHRVGLLREAGPHYQFRHAKLQDRLAETYRAQNK
jgi:hypothetical protein